MDKDLKASAFIKEEIDAPWVRHELTFTVLEDSDGLVIDWKGGRVWSKQPVSCVCKKEVL